MKWTYRKVEGETYYIIEEPQTEIDAVRRVGFVDRPSDAPKVAAVPDLLDVLIFLDTAIMPKMRKYDEYGYCRIHRGILEDFDRRIKTEIRKARGE